MALTKVLITVKTYPTISTKYDELVCTAGFKEDGSWIRIYPIQFRQKPYQEQYKKWQWVELDLVKNTSDPRPESYRPVSHDTPINIAGEIPSDGGAWINRRPYALKRVFTNKTLLINEAKNTKITTSPAVFKPKAITDFVIEPVEREWDDKKLEHLKQLNLFESASPSGRFEVVKKLPYKFSYVFLDEEDTPSKLMIEDWEIGQLYWNALRNKKGDEALACADVKKKYFEDFAKTKDLHLFLGTTQIHHFSSPNPFIIIGTFHPKHLTQGRLF